MKDKFLMDYTIGNTTTQDTPDKAKNKAYFWAMEESNYTINLRDLSIYESLIFPDSFKEYSEMAEFLLRRKSMFILEDSLIELHKDEPQVKDLMELGNIPIGAITAAFPNRFVREGIHPKIGGAEHEGVWGWIDLWSDYI